MPLLGRTKVLFITEPAWTQEVKAGQDDGAWAQGTGQGRVQRDADWAGGRLAGRHGSGLAIAGRAYDCLLAKVS